MERKQFIADSAKHSALALTSANIFRKKSFASASVLPNQELVESKKSSQVDMKPTYEDVTTTVRLKGKEVKVHGLCTGTVAVKTAFRTKKGFGPLAKLNILLDSTYTEFMPIWVWVIEHPEGTVIIDTGETTSVKDRKHYLAKESSYARYVSQHTSKFIIDENNALNFKLDKIKIKLADIKLVVLTHLHLDHTDGLKFFPNTEIMVNEYEFNHPYSNLPTTYPSWFRPNKVNYKKNRVDVFNDAFPITLSEDLLYVPTPGHTHGHSSVIFKTDDLDIIFAGDSSYKQEQVLNLELAGVNIDFAKTLQTYKHLMAYSKRNKSIYLPTHDARSGIRLQNKSFMV
jgi:N-acyl homoserine lactone hydrolase